MKNYVLRGEIFVDAKWAKLNKQNTLAEYEAECERGDYDTVQAKVAEAYFLTGEEWNELTNDFLEDNAIYSEKGGHGSRYELPYAYKNTESLWELPEEEQRKWRDEAYRIAILIVNEETGASCLVDPQGYNYARYVGIPVFKGIGVSVYRFPMGDCTNGGISGRETSLTILTDEPRRRYSEETNIFKVLVKETRNIGGNPYTTVKPLTGVIKGEWQMMGGNFAFTSDQRFIEEFGHAPVAIHDRVE